MDTLDATLWQIMHHAPPKHNPKGIPFLIAVTECGKTVKGPMRKPCLSIPYRFWGGWKPDRGETAFYFDAADEVVGTDARSITRYLARNVPAIGNVRAAAIVKALGPDCLKQLREDPDLIYSVENMPESAARALAKFFEENPADPATYAELVALFDGLKVPRSVLNRLVKDYGDKAAQWVKESPYSLRRYPRMGWKTVDSFATQRAGVSFSDLRRQAAAIIEGLETLAREGHTVVPIDAAKFIASQLLGAWPSDEAWSLTATDTETIDDPQGRGEHYVGLSRLVDAERRIAQKVALLMRSAPDERIVMPPEAFYGLNEGQEKALCMLASEPISILRGGPGTGKTYTLSRFLKYLSLDQKLGTRCAAPTGKAAKRIAELMSQFDIESVETSTVHRMLGLISSDDRDDNSDSRNTWNYCASNPLPYGTIVIDETSMLDCSLAAAVFDAVGVGSRLILIGDPNQLPAVGPGAVLRDLLESNIPRVELTEVRRNAGRIVRACHGMQEEEHIEPSRKIDLAEGENWAHISAEGPEIADRIAEQIVKFKGIDLRWDVQVVSPQHNLPFGCDALNQRLSLLLNPHATPETNSDGRFAIGDKVVRTKNGTATCLIPYDAALQGPDDSRFQFEWNGNKYSEHDEMIVNGDMGEVLDIIEAPEGSNETSKVIVQFRWPDRLMWLLFDQCKLERAYAMTVHKCQGSGYPVVVVPVHSGFYWDQKRQRGIWCRELVYTAFSRAERLLITVGSLHAVREAVSRVTVHQRKTTLAARLRALANDAAILS